MKNARTRKKRVARQARAVAEPLEKADLTIWPGENVNPGGNGSGESDEKEGDCLRRESNIKGKKKYSFIDLRRILEEAHADPAFDG